MRITERLSGLFEIDSSTHRIVPMEGLRGLAVFLVFIVHYVTLIEPWIRHDAAAWQVADTLRSIGHSGVDLFFVLSGYLIYGTLIARHRDLWKYARRRVERIYPCFLAVFLLYLALCFVFPAESKLPAGAGPASIYIVENLLLLPGMLPIEPLITVAWSLSFEFFYYLVIPILIVALRLRRWPVSMRIALFLLLSVACLLSAPTLGVRVRLVMFLAGIVLYETRHLLAPRLADLGGLLVFIAALFAIAWLPGTALPPVLRYCALYVGFYAICLGSFSGQGLLAALFSLTPLRWLGNMSYSYYLIHGLVLKTFFMVLQHVMPPAEPGTAMLYAALLPAFAATWIVSAILFAIVEKPWSLTAHAPTAAASAPRA